MIKIDKKSEPNILVTNKTTWLSALMLYVNSGQKIPDSVKNKYNHDDIKATLKDETHGKCMYCESPISVVSPEHIEHYRPKSIYPNLTFEWTNLGLACPWCNIKKDNNFDENCTIINPYIDNPDDHFISLGTMICHKPGDNRSQLTELLLELNRPELMESRKNRIDAIRPLIDQYMKETNPTLRDILKKNIEKEKSNDKPYSMCVKSTIKQMINI
jgi:uncharacterized protein (TIGR02646 family)